MRIHTSVVMLGLLAAGGLAQAMDFGEFYKSMHGKEVSLSFQDSHGHIMLGVSTFEKSEGNVLCRRSGPMVPRPVYSYTCYVAMSGTDSNSLYRDTQGEPVTVVRNDGSRVVVLEKTGAGYICQLPQSGRSGIPVSAQCYAALHE